MGSSELAHDFVCHIGNILMELISLLNHVIIDVNYIRRLKVLITVYSYASTLSLYPETMHYPKVSFYINMLEVVCKILNSYETNFPYETKHLARNLDFNNLYKSITKVYIQIFFF